jgi:hypothetical protein
MTLSKGTDRTLDLRLVIRVSYVLTVILFLGKDLVRGFVLSVVTYLLRRSEFGYAQKYSVF